MPRPPKFDRPISIEEAQKSRQRFSELKKTVHYIGDPEHKKNPNHDFECIPLTHYKRGKTCCDDVNIFKIKTALYLLHLAFEKGLVSPAENSKEWPKRVWAVTENGKVLEGRHTGNGQYHGFPVLDDSAMVKIVNDRW
jgi:hypothetical protein